MCLKKTNKTEQAKVLDYFIITKEMIKEMKSYTFAVDIDSYLHRLEKCLGNNYKCFEGEILPDSLDYLVDKIKANKIQTNVDPTADDIFKIAKYGDKVLPVCCFNDFYLKTCCLEITEKEKQKYIKVVDDFWFFLIRYVQAGGIVIIDYVQGIISDCESLKREMDFIKREITK